jgi:hypothetical protein
VRWGRRRRAEGADAWSSVSEMAAMVPLVDSGEMVAASGVGGGHDARGVRGGALAGRSEHKRGCREERRVRVVTCPF